VTTLTEQFNLSEAEKPQQTSGSSQSFSAGAFLFLQQTLLYGVSSLKTPFEPVQLNAACLIAQFPERGAKDRQRSFLNGNSKKILPSEFSGQCSTR
jgi:hypothetical protein